VNSLGQDREEAVHDLVPLFSIDLLSQIHGAVHVGEEHGYLLAFAFEGVSGGQDLLREVLGV
jgi:hypothetical protein